MTAYLIPVGTQGTIAVPGHEPKPHFARRQLHFTTPPELTTHWATFNFAKGRLTVPREAVIVSDRSDSGVRKRIDT